MRVIVIVLNVYFKCDFNVSTMFYDVYFCVLT